MDSEFDADRVRNIRGLQDEPLPFPAEDIEYRPLDMVSSEALVAVNLGIMLPPALNRAELESLSIKTYAQMREEFISSQMSMLNGGMEPTHGKRSGVVVQPTEDFQEPEFILPATLKEEILAPKSETPLLEFAPDAPTETIENRFNRRIELE